MAIQTVNTGTTPNDGTGDPARTAFIKLNDNFTAAENAASKLVATTDQAIAGTAGVLPDAAGVHAAFNQFGLGIEISEVISDANSITNTGWSSTGSDWTGSVFPGSSGSNQGYIFTHDRGSGYRLQTFYNLNFTYESRWRRLENGVWTEWIKNYHTGNTTVDANGFIKAASPIANLYHDRAESNGSEELKNMQFERIDTGHYRLTGVPELSRNGWYVETPKDRNGNIYFTLDYVESDGQLDIYTYTPDYSTGRATNGAPVDIIDGRFVSLRFADADIVPQDDVTPV